MRTLSLFPYRVQLALGRRIGRLARHVAVRRRKIAERNIAACFPELDVDARERILRGHFESLGIGLAETALCWFADNRRLARLAQMEGLEHLRDALSAGHGVLMLSAHFTCLEMGARLLCLQTPLHVMYRKHENPLWEEILRRGRARHAEKVIQRTDVRGLIRSLRDNKAVWFAPDQAPRGKDRALVNFFSEPAHTNTATSRIAKITGAAVLPYFPERKEDGSGYRLIVGAPLENFPSGDAAADATLFNRIIEARVREVPEQYLWIHRRFKDRPPPLPDLYEGLA